MTHIKIPSGQVITIELPGLTAIRIDTAQRMVAIDNISGQASPEEPIGPEWNVCDLRHGTYGGFHRLKASEECFDPDCARRGEHIDPVREVTT